MTEQNPAVFLQAGSHPAEDVRRMFTAISGGVGGIVGSGDLLCAEAGTPNMTVVVAGGAIWVPGSEAAYQGMYFCENRATTAVTIATADGTNPRKDLIVAKVQDAGYSAATNAWSLSVVTGTPAGSPAEPTAPANSITLAMVDVPASDTAITNSQIADRRIISAKGKASQGSVTTTSAARPASPDEGDVIYETDTNTLLSYDGSAWVAFADDDTLHFDTANNRAGIGTTSPASDLHIGGSSVVTFTNSANTAGKRGMRIGFDNDRLSIQRASDAGAWEANYLVVDQDTGKVGIGNTAPAYPLSVTGTSQANGFSVSSSIASVHHAGSLGFTDANHGMLFRPPVAGAVSAYAFQDYAGANNLWEVTDAGVSNFRGSGTSAAYNDGGTWGTISDARLKTITERITDSNYLAKLNRFGLIKYVLDKEFTRVEAIGEELDNQEPTWEITDKETPSYEMLGVVAQEVREFAPGLVDENPTNGQLQVKTSVLTWMLVGAVQELSAKLDGQEAVNASLVARLDALEAS
jgi:hypothetical protein